MPEPVKCHIVMSNIQTSGLPHEVRPVRLQSCLDFPEKKMAAAGVTGQWCSSLVCQKLIMAVPKVCCSVEILIGQPVATQNVT